MLVRLGRRAAALAAPAAAVAQESAPGPSLQIVAADLRQIGGDLRFELRFSRPLPVDELDPSGAGSCASC